MHMLKSKNREQHVEPILKTIRNEYERSLDNINLISTSTVNTFLTNIQKQDLRRERIH